MQKGSFVICIDDTNWDELAYVHMSGLPQKNYIYKIRRIIDGFGNDGLPGVALEGIYGTWKNHVNNDGQTVFEEYHFKMTRFREIESPESFVESVLESITEEIYS